MAARRRSSSSSGISNVGRDSHTEPLSLPSLTVGPSISIQHGDNVLDDLIEQLFVVYDFTCERRQSHAFNLRQSSGLMGAEFCLVQKHVSSIVGAWCRPSSGSTKSATSRPGGVSRGERSNSLPPGTASAGLEVALRPAVVRNPPPRAVASERRPRSPIAQRRANMLPSLGRCSAVQNFEGGRPSATAGRNSSLERYGQDQFEHVDKNGDGKIDFDEFRSWQWELLNASKKARQAKQQRLTWLLRDLTALVARDEHTQIIKNLVESGTASAHHESKGDVYKAIETLKTATTLAAETLDEDKEIFLAAARLQLQETIDRLGARLFSAMENAATLDTLKVAILEAERATQDGFCPLFTADVLEPYRKKMDEWYAVQFTSALENADSLLALEAAIKEAEEQASHCQSLTADALKSYRGKAEEWRKPFAIQVSTIAGTESRVEGTRDQTVADLKKLLEADLGVKAYRISLCNEDHKLQPDTATLDNFGLHLPGSPALIATFGEVNRFLEIPPADFLQLAVDVKAMNPTWKQDLEERMDSGNLTYEACLAAWGARVTDLEEIELKRAAEKASREAKQLKQQQWLDGIASEAQASAMMQWKGASSKDLTKQIQTAEGVKVHISLENASKTRDALLLDCVVAQAVDARFREELLKLEATLATQAEVATTCQDDVQHDLDEALPLLEDAIERLRNLDKRDVAEIHCIKNPPTALRLAMEALCIMLQIKPRMMSDNLGRKMNDYWQPAKQLLQDANRLMDSLMCFDKDNIPDRVIQQITPYVHHELLAVDYPRGIKQVSVAGGAFVTWIHALYRYHFIAKVAEPKRKALRDHQETLQGTHKAVHYLQERLLAEQQDFRKKCAALSGTAPDP